MRIATVTPSRPYKVVSPDGNETRAFLPGDILTVVRTRYSECGEIFSVNAGGCRFDIPSDSTTTVEELAIV